MYECMYECMNVGAIRMRARHSTAQHAWARREGKGREGKGKERKGNGKERKGSPLCLDFPQIDVGFLGRIDEKCLKVKVFQKWLKMAPKRLLKCGWPKNPKKRQKAEPQKDVFQQKKCHLIIDTCDVIFKYQYYCVQ